MAEKFQLRLFEPREPTAPISAAELRGLAVREVACRSLLNRSRGGDYSFNFYPGFDRGCVYCSAPFMHPFHAQREPWGAFVDVKSNAREVLAGQIRRLRPG